VKSDRDIQLWLYCGGARDLRLQADAAEASRAPLPVIQVESVEAAERFVEQAGGVIIKSTFSFPGGKRFHFRDPPAMN
jgi:predicted enzyme related to lactoylglutathione lyase